MPTSPCTIFIPLLNEEEIVTENTERLLSFMDERKIQCEMILGSNGSTDRTPAIIEDLASRHPNVKAFHLDIKGPGMAFSHAVQMASYEYIVSQDADLSVDLEFIPLAISLLDNCDIVIGCKSVQNRSFFRKLGSNLFIFTAAVLLDVGTPDFSLGAKAYRRSFVASHLDRLDAGTAYVLELVYWAVTQRRRVIEFPVQCSDTRRSRFSLPKETYHKFSHLFRFVKQQRGRVLQRETYPSETVEGIIEDKNNFCGDKINDPAAHSSDEDIGEQSSS